MSPGAADAQRRVIADDRGEHLLHIARRQDTRDASHSPVVIPRAGARQKSASRWI
jgi:hypothetical protein